MTQKNSLILLIVITTLINSLNVTCYNAKFVANNDVVFSISFVHNKNDECEYEQNEVENIKINVYRSDMTSDFDDISVKVFEHTYAFSVFSNKMGMVEFEKPSDYFYISIDITTLPKNTTVKESNKFYTPDNNNDQIIIYDKDSVEFIKSFKEKSVDELYQADLNTILLSEEQNRDRTIEFIYDELYRLKKCNKKSMSNIRSENVFDISSLIEFTSESVKKDILTKLDLLQFLIEVFDNFGRNTELCMVLNGLIEDKSFYNNLCEDQKYIIKKIMSPTSYNKLYTNGYFEIYYEYDDTDIPIFISTLYNALSIVYNDLIIDTGLNRPKSETIDGNDKYEIFVNSASDDAEAMTIPILDDIGASFIIIPNIDDLDIPITNSLKGTMAHEYMHAIMHNYKDLNQLPLWFVESWAEWTVYKVYGLNSYYHGTYYANHYLNNISVSLSSNNDVYGKVLYPLFLEQNYGGEGVVISVINNLPVTVDVYNAISTALQSHNATFDSSFPEFGKYIYAPKRYYNPYLSGWNSSPYILHSYSVNSYPACEYEDIEPLSMQYREFDLPTGNDYALCVTLTADNNPSSLKCRVFFNNLNGELVTSSGFVTIGSTITTVYACNPNFIKGALMVSNIHHTNTVYYYCQIYTS